MKWGCLMNNQRNSDLKNSVMKMLARLNAPRAVAGNTEAMKQEAEFLCSVVVKVAPSRGYTDWFSEFEEQVFSNLETRTWPTSKEMHKAAKTIAPKRPDFKDLTGDNVYKPDEYKINANRIKRGEPVGQYYIMGGGADALIRKGLVTEDDIEPYIHNLTPINKY